MSHSSYLKRNAVIMLTALITGFMSILGCYTFSFTRVYAASSYKDWSQSDPEWANMYLGQSGENMSQIGCAVTAVAMLVVHSRSRAENTFNPGILCGYLSANGGFDSGGNIYWGAVTGLVNEFTFEKSVLFKGTTQAEKAAELQNYMSMGYYAVICVKYGGHWVAVDRVSGSTVYIMDPSSAKYTNLFEAYDNDGITHIKLFKGIASTGAAVKKAGTYVTDDTINLRANAGTYYTSIDTIPSGTEIQVTDISGNWGKILYNGKIGWICLDYASLTEETPTAETTVPVTETPSDYIKGMYMVTSNSGLYYRSGPGTENTSYGLLSYGTYVVVNEVNGNWGNIDYNGYDAWICLDYAQYISPIETTVTETTTETTPVSEEYKAGEYIITSDDGLYYRSGPGTENTAYGVLPYGTEVVVTEVKNGWGRINYNGYDAWIYLLYTSYKGNTQETTVETTMPPESSTPVIEVLSGDINTDGKVNIYDVILLKKYILKLSELSSVQKANADINADGKINVDDYSMLKQMMLGK